MLPIIAGRALLVATCMPFVTAVSRLALAGHPQREPLPKWRSAPTRAFLAWWARFLLRAGFACVPTVTGSEHLASAEAARAVIVYNHVSFLDSLALEGACGAPSPVAKAGVADAPGFGAFARALQCVFVSRAGSDDRAAADRTASLPPSPPTSRPSSADPGATTPVTPPVAGGSGASGAIAARAADGRFPLVALAPEGTTKVGACLLRFRTGAFVPGRPVLPVLLSYGGGGGPGARGAPSSFHPGWGRVASSLAHFLRSQVAPRNALAIRILPLYTPSPAEAADPARFAENVRHHMAAALGVPPVAASLGEWAALKQAGICTDVWGRRVLWRPVAGGPLEELEGGVGAVRAGAAAAGAAAGGGGRDKRD